MLKRVRYYFPVSCRVSKFRIIYQYRGRLWLGCPAERLKYIIASSELFDEKINKNIFFIIFFGKNFFWKFWKKNVRLDGARRVVVFLYFENC